METSLTLTKDEATKAVRGEHPDFKVIDEKWISREKGVDYHWVVIQDNNTQKFYEKYYHRGFRPSGSEGWDVHPFHYEEPVFQEVELREIITKKWCPVDTGQKTSMGSFKLK